MFRFLTVFFILLNPFNLYAKCATPLINEATVEILSCQGVVFSASESKYNIFDSGVFDVPHIPGGILTGTLIVGKVSHAKELDSKKASALSNKQWINGDIRNFFIALPPSEACPKILPDARKIVEQAKCCDVIPSGGACLLPQTIPIVYVSK